MEIAVRRDETDVTRQLHDSLPAALNAMKRVSGEQTFDIIRVALSMEPYSRRGLGLPFSVQAVHRLLTNARNRDALAEFRIKGRNRRTQSIEIFDLLEDKMISEVRVVAAGERRRSIDSESMFHAIEDAFRAQREELLALAGQD